METEDLNLLDDDKRHATCGMCQAFPKPFVAFVGICGKRAVNRDKSHGVNIPRNACPECLAVISCPRCGGDFR